MLLHPGTAKIDCDECRKWVYDLKTGEKELRQSGPKREILPYQQPGPPPCDSCPKKPPGQTEPMTPEQGKSMELSSRNQKAWKHFSEAKAVGVSETERTDPIVRRNFALLSALTSAAEQKSQAQSVATELAVLFSQLKGARP